MIKRSVSETDTLRFSAYCFYPFASVAGTVDSETHTCNYIVYKYVSYNFE